MCHSVVTTDTGTSRPTYLVVSKAFTVQLDALRLTTVASFMVVISHNRLTIGR